MTRELLQSRTYKTAIHIDPRTKIFLVISISSILITGKTGGIMDFINPVLGLIPAVLLLGSKKYGTVALYVGIYTVGFLAQLYLMPITTGILNFLTVAVVGLFFRFISGIMMGFYLVSTTSVSEFTASMERMNMPRQIIIPISVMFRFFPTVYEEASAINDAMRMRGVTFRNPMRMLEYRLVPIMMCSVKIGEELSAASLTRGLGAPVKRTNICKIGFGIWDAMFILIAVIGWVSFIFA